MRSRFLIVLAASLCASAYAYSQDAAGVAMEFAARGTDPVSYALGGTTAFNSTASLIHGDAKGEISFNFAPYKTKATKATDLGANVFIKAGEKLAFGVTFFREGLESIDNYNAQGVKSGSFTPSNMAVGGSVAYKFMPELSLGASVRYLDSKLTDSDKFNTVAVDVMVSGAAGGFKYAAGVTNLGGKIKDSAGEEYPIPSAATAAGRYGYSGGEHSIEGTLQADVFFKGGLRAGIGAQYGFKDMLFVRAGYSHGGDTVLPSYPSAGIGVKFGSFQLDATALFGDLAGTFVAGLKFRF